MLRARDVIIVGGIVALLAILMSVISLMGPNDSDGWGEDSYGTRADGQRGIYDLMRELKVPVARRIEPPTGLDKDELLVIWGPDSAIVSTEPAYLDQVAKWIKSGGTVVIAPETGKTAPMAAARLNANANLISITEALGFAEIVIEEIDLTASREPQHHSFKTKYWDQEAAQLIPANARAEGELASAMRDVKRLAVPALSLRVFDDKSTASAVGLVRIDYGGKTHTIAADYRTGTGRLVVVSDPRLLSNHALGEEDNAVLAARLLVAPGRQVVFDEFYHGLTVRGNPFWLLTNFPYGLIGLLIVAWLSLWAWRSGVHLGPALPDEVASRRSVVEYVDAMGRLFLRAGSRRHLIRLVRDGALWMLRRRFNLPPGDESRERLLLTISRRDPARAARLKEALATADKIILSVQKPGSRELAQAAGKVMACL